MDFWVNQERKALTDAQCCRALKEVHDVLKARKPITPEIDLAMAHIEMAAYWLTEFIIENIPQKRKKANEEGNKTDD